MSSTTMADAWRQVTIDSARMFAAMSGVEGDEERCAGFLNRQTGEIEFVWDSEGNALADAGTDAAIDSHLARNTVAANPEVWIAIPKYHPWVEGREKQEEFCERFFREHGLEVKLK